MNETKLKLLTENSLSYSAIIGDVLFDSMSWIVSNEMKESGVYA